jgi:glycerate 2-kinase
MKVAIKAVDPEILIRQKMRLNGSKLVLGHSRIDLSSFERILVLGGGKAALGMALAVERVLESRITAGVVNVPSPLAKGTLPRRIKLKPASHPIPSQRGVAGVKRMLAMVGKPGSKDLIFLLLSGGASSMLPLPAPGVSVDVKQKVTRSLLASGASIREINTVRRHLSGIKGGRLAERLYPATVLTLIISDVVGDEIEDVGSGPTAPDPSTYQDARKVLEKYQLWNGSPEAIKSLIRRGMAGVVGETPKPGSKVFQHVHNEIVGSNKEACLAAAESLKRSGYRTTILTRRMAGDARRAGETISNTLAGLEKRPAAVISAGETTVSVRGNGMGGRNQELVLAASLALEGLERVLVVSVGTDGRDGPTNAAGAIADGETVRRALRKGMSPKGFLENNDSYNFFRRLKDLVVTGPTGTNVGDLTLALAGKLR